MTQMEEWNDVSYFELLGCRIGYLPIAFVWTSYYYLYELDILRFMLIREI